MLFGGTRKEREEQEGDTEHGRVREEMDFVCVVVLLLFFLVKGEMLMYVSSPSLL